MDLFGDGIVRLAVADTCACHLAVILVEESTSLAGLTAAWTTV
jgi:hypothetical protein